MCRCGEFRAEGTAADVLAAQRQHLRKAHGIVRAPQRKQTGRRPGPPRLSDEERARRQMQRQMEKAQRKQAREEERRQDIGRAREFIIERLRTNPMSMQETMREGKDAGLMPSYVWLAFRELRAEGRLRDASASASKRHRAWAAS
jgi:hypothetical protein